MQQSEFLEHFAEMIEMPAGGVSGGEKLDSLPGWNSMAMMSLIAFAEEHFAKSLSPRSFANCDTVGDLARLVGVHQVEKEA